jgi:hypothetical protein
VLPIIKAAINATLPGGMTADYFQNEGSWEGPLRHDFVTLRELMTSDPEGGRGLALRLYKKVNDRYHATRRPPDFPLVYDVMKSAIDSRGWWAAEPPKLFDLPNDQLGTIGYFVPAILSELKSQEHDYTYSLITKLLHFHFPHTFAIYDFNVANSLETWSVEEQGGPGKANPALLEYRIDILTVSSGESYGSILKFHRRCWAFARTTKTADSLIDAAQRMERMLRKQSVSEAARVTPLDVIDKLLWRANGDPVKLGLLDS